MPNQRSNQSETDEPSEQEVLAAIAEEEEGKYGGGDRWILTFFFVLMVPCTVWLVHQRDLFAIFMVPLGILCGVLMAINWRSWLKKTPAQRAAQRAENPLETTRIKNSIAHKVSHRHARHRHLRHGHRHLTDLLVLMVGPMAAIIWLGWNRIDSGTKWVLAIMILMVGAVFYFFPEKATHEDAANTTRPDAVSEKRLFNWMLLIPAVLSVGLLYLVWMHTVLDLAGLAAFTVVVPAAIVLASFGIARHAGKNVKQGDKSPPERLTYLMLGLWALAVFIFCVCLVSLLQKYVLKW